MSCRCVQPPKFSIEMAKPQIEHGKFGEMKALARKIVKDQTKEIAQLDAWISQHS